MVRHHRETYCRRNDCIANTPETAKEKFAQLRIEAEALREEKKALKELLEKIRPKHRHDHDYFHDDCGLCQIEKIEYAKFAQALQPKEKEK